MYLCKCPKLSTLYPYLFYLNFTFYAVVIIHNGMANSVDLHPGSALSA